MGGGCFFWGDLARRWGFRGVLGNQGASQNAGGVQVVKRWRM